MDFVLVHGTTQSPAGWDRLVAALTRRGHRGVTVDLWTDEPLVGVGDYAQLAAAQVSACNGPVVVAHSGSGALLPIIAEALDATAMVWLAAYIPDFTNRRSLFDEIQAYPTRLFHADWLGVDPTADTSAACRFLFHDCDPDLQQWALTTLRAFAPTAAYRHRPSAESPTIPSICIAATADRTRRTDWMLQAASDRLGVHAATVDAGHCQHVSRPEAVADILTTIRSSRSW